MFCEKRNEVEFCYPQNSEKQNIVFFPRKMLEQTSEKMSDMVVAASQVRIRELCNPIG